MSSCRKAAPFLQDYLCLCTFPYLCQLQIGTCHGCLPSTSTRIKSCATVAADLQHPLKGVQGGEQKWGTLCLGSWQDRSSDRYFQEPILWAQFLYLLISRKTLESSWWRLFLLTSKKLLYGLSHQGRNTCFISSLIKNTSYFIAHRNFFPLLFLIDSFVHYLQMYNF